jgi:hypothetical protein
MTARRIAVVVGIGWMALIGALGAWLGFSEAFLGATGLIFEGGYGEIYLLAALFFPGYLIHRWGRSHA